LIISSYWTSTIVARWFRFSWRPSRFPSPVLALSRPAWMSWKTGKKEPRT